jgi:hypothetical protein
VFRLLLTSLLLGTQLVLGGSTEALSGRVVDARSFRPIGDAIVTSGNLAVRTNADGVFTVRGVADQLGVRAYGYMRTSIPVDELRRQEGQIALLPFRPKALYLTSVGWQDRPLREAALAIAERTEVNALVIDVKGDHGLVAFPSGVRLAIAAGAERSARIGNLEALTQALHARGIYTIARIVVFKDNVLAPARPDLAIRARDGRLWRDREGLAWTDPFLREVWEYNVDLAVAAARGGFDEIQFDYVRFPDARGLVFSQSSTERNRIAAISGFLELAREQLARYNVFLSADIFGYVCWNLDDTGIGQTLEGMLPYVDYLSPMLYPSTFQFGIPGYRDPVAHPHEVIYQSLEHALERTRVPPVRFRPWLQAFKDYAFDRRDFGSGEIRTQISAAQKAGTNGWMLWNPRNVYSSGGLGPKSAPKGVLGRADGTPGSASSARTSAPLVHDLWRAPPQ